MINTKNNIYLNSKFLFMFLCFISIFSCTSISVNKTSIDNIDKSSTNYSKSLIKETKKIKKGSLLILLQSKRANLSYTPKVKSILLELKNKPYFSKVSIDSIKDISIKSINYNIRKAKNNKYKYLLIVSYYTNNSVSQKKLHTFLKTSTLNLYDLFPFLAPVTYTFNHHYAFSFEASLIDIGSNFILDNFVVNEFMDKPILGGSDPNDINIIYKQDVINRAAKKLVKLI